MVLAFAASVSTARSRCIPQSGFYELAETFLHLLICSSRRLCQTPFACFVVQLFQGFIFPNELRDLIKIFFGSDRSDEPSLASTHTLDAVPVRLSRWC